MLGLSVYNGAARMQPVKDKYILEFPAGADMNHASIYSAKTIHVKTIRVIEGAGNFSSYSIKKKGLLVNELPLELTARDLLTLELSNWNNNLVKLEVNADVPKTEKTARAHVLGGNGQFLYALMHVDQTVWAMDTDTHQATVITLPADMNFCTLEIHPAQKRLYLFGANTAYYVAIDIDPLSLSFNSIVASGVFGAGNVGSAKICLYDWQKDNWWLQNGSSMYIASGDLQTVLNLAPVHISGAGFGGHMSLFPNGIFTSDLSVGFLYDTDTYMIKGSSGVSLTGAAKYNYNNGFIYHATDGLCRVRRLDLSLYQTINNSAFRRGAVALAGNYCFGGDSLSNNIGVIDMITNTSLGVVAKGSPAVNEIGSRSVITSPYNGKVYVQAKANTDLVTGVDRIHIFNPSLPLAEMYEGYIQVGNMMANSIASDQYIAQQMAFNYINYDNH